MRGQMLGRSCDSFNLPLTMTYLVLPSLNRALVLRFSQDLEQPRAANLNSKRKLSLGSPDPNQEAGPSKLPDDHRSTVTSHTEGISERTERPRKSRRLSGEEDMRISGSSDPTERDLPNLATSGFTLQQRAQSTIPTLCTENPRVSCPLCSRQVPYNSINPHMDSNCKKYFLGDDTTAVAKPNSKAAWGSIFKGQGKKAATVLRSVARADHAVPLKFISIRSQSAQDLEIPTAKLAKVSYGLLTLSALRKLLAETGLPTNGDRDELIARHER
jgi:SAP domain